MPMYSKPEKIICILKESIQRGLEGSCPHKKFGPPFKACPVLYDDFKTSPSPSFCSSKSHE